MNIKLNVAITRLSNRSREHEIQKLQFVTRDTGNHKLMRSIDITDD